MESVSAGARLRVSGRSDVLLYGGRSVDEYQQGEIFNDVDLANSLNHSTDSEGLESRYKLTPLTTFVIQAQALQDRFFYNSLRDANSIKVLPGFELKPAALISGKVFVGVRRLDPLNPDLPKYQGVAAAVDASVINGSRLFQVTLNRDTVFSYPDTDPYTR